jgi:hypothetical protein
MHNSARFSSVRRTVSQCKRPAPAGLGGAVCLVLLPWLSACSSLSAPQTITLATLENAPPAATTEGRRVIVSDTTALRDMCTPLGPRLGLLQVRSAAQWARLVRAAPQIGPAPDFGTGIFIGIACWAGTPVDGHWPIHIDTVRVHDGAGLVTGAFEGGSYLPDGTAVLETAHVKGLMAVLAVDLNGTTFYPR